MQQYVPLVSLIYPDKVNVVAPPPNQNMHHGDPLHLSFLVEGTHICFYSRSMGLEGLLLWISFHALSFLFHLIPHIDAVDELAFPLYRLLLCLCRVVFIKASVLKQLPKLTNTVHMEEMYDHASLRACPCFLFTILISYRD